LIGLSYPRIKLMLTKEIASKLEQLSIIRALAIIQNNSFHWFERVIVELNCKINIQKIDFNHVVRRFYLLIIYY
jgi:hypothetical protein